MGERNNGYASCDLRGLRGLGGLGNASRRGRGEVGCGCGAMRQGNMSGGCGCGGDREGGRAYESDRPREGACADRGAHAMMHKLQQLDFSIQETVLYLDAYPHCAAALQHYRQLVCEREALVKQYEQQYGPLTARGNVSGERWDWVDAPWPWHPEHTGNTSGGKQG